MSGTTHRIAEAISEYIVELNQTRIADMIAAFDTVDHANDELRYITGIRDFFKSRREFEEFRHLVNRPLQKANSQKTKEWGDFQTPPGLARRVCQYLSKVGVVPSTIVEPTYGQGNFIIAALDAFPTVGLVYGIEIQEKYEWHLKIALLIKALPEHHCTTEIELHRDDIFSHVFSERLLETNDILVIGNPPWVTNAELGALGSDNLPTKLNIKTLNGMDALTGKSNFDISEYILLRLLDFFSHRQGTLAMLCKSATAKNIVEILPQKQFPVSNIRMLGFDANREFGVTVDACLLTMDLGAPQAARTCQVATLENPDRVTRVFGWVDDKFVSNVEAYRSNSDLDGKSVLVWRQGLKHDCAPIMELEVREGTLVNGKEEVVDVEEEYLYWLLKSSDLRGFEGNHPHKKVIVTQSRLGEDTLILQTNAPKLWKYLMKNKQFFEKRKSSIYRDKPPFSIFGIGEYSFKNYKVAISGLYKQPNFTLISPIGNRPVMLDDTCYFLGFDNYIDALFTTSLFNSAPIIQFLSSVVFQDAKRPYTKDVLMRINTARAASKLSLQTLYAFWQNIGYKPQVIVSESDLNNYKQRFQDVPLAYNLQMEFI